MNEELKFTLTAESSGVKKGADEAASSLNRVGAAYESSAQKGKQAESLASKMVERLRRVGKIGLEARDALRKMEDAAFVAMDRANRTAKETQDALAKYNGMSSAKLTKELSNINIQLEQQKQKLEQAQQELAKYLNSQMDYFSKANFSDADALKANIDDSEYKELIATITQLQDTMFALQNQQLDCDEALTNAEGVERLAANTRQAAEQMKVANDQTKLSFDAVGFALSTIGSIGGPTVSKLTSIVQQVRYMKQGFTAAAQSAGTMGKALTVGLGAVGIGLSVVSMIVSGISEATEKARQKAEELKNEIKEMSSNNVSASGLISEYEALSNKTVKTAEDTKRMKDIRAELVEQYGYSAEAVDEEGRLLAGNLDIMKEQLAVERERLLLKLEENEKNTEKDFDKNMKKRKSLLQEVADLEEKIANPEKAMRDEGFFEYTSEDLEKQVEAWEQAKKDAEQGLEEYDRAVRPSIQEMFQQIILTAQAEGEEVPEEVQGVIRDVLERAFEAGEDGETAKSWAQDALERYFEIEEDVILDNTLPGINSLKQKMVAAIFSDSEGEMPEGSADFINQLFAGLSEDDQQFLDKFLTLQEKVKEGTASIQEELEFEGMKTEGFRKINELMGQNARHFEENPKLVKYASSALRGYRDDLGATVTSLDKTAKTQEKAEEAVRDFANGGQDAIKRVSEIKKEMNSLGQQRAAIEILKEGKKGSQEYADALEYLSDNLDMEPSDILENLGLIDQQLGVSEEEFASFINLIASNSKVKFEMQNDGSIKAVGEEANEASQEIAAMLNMLLASNGSTINLDVNDGKIGISAKAPKFTGGGNKKKSGGGGGGSSKNSALERELALLEHKKAMDQLTTQEEIDNLERILNKYAKTNEEKEDIIEKLYSLRKQKAKEDLEYQKAMDQLTLREEISAIDAQIAAYKAGTQARLDLEKERYSLAKELQRQEYDLKVYYGQLTLKQQEQQLSLMLADYKKGTQARIDLEKELYDIQQQIRENGISRIDSVADGVIQALQNRYAEQQRIEAERLEESKENWKKWGDEQVEAIQKQIDALDELTKQEDKEEQERQKRRKIASLEQQLLYENDLYNQKKLQEQLAAAKKDLDDWLRQQEREELKASLQEQISQIQQKVEAEQEKIDKQIEANDKYYEELTKEQNLQAEAQKLLMKNNQAEILNLLKNFAPDYNLTGQSLGEQLVDGFMGKVADIEAWFGGLTAKFSQYQNQIASIATQAADEFYRTHGVAAGMQTGAAATGAIAASAPQITMIFNQPVESPTEIRREMERLAEQLANL